MRVLRFARRAVMRCVITYLGLFCAGSVALNALVPPVRLLPLYELAPFRGIVFWTTAHVLHRPVPTHLTGSASGDRSVDWAFLATILACAIAVSIVWAIVDRNALEEGTFYVWCRLFVRLTLAAMMIGYGMLKIVPIQMPFPDLSTLVEPYKDFSPFGVLWSSIGVAPAYEIFAGCAELVAGIALAVPRTALLGALVSAADMTQVTALDLTYDVPQKIVAFHLLAIALFLIAPDAKRLVDFFFSRTGAAPGRREPQLFRSPRANDRAAAFQFAFAVFLVVSNARIAVAHRDSGERQTQRSSLYGIWNVERFAIDGRERPALLTSRERPRRMIFERRADRAEMQRMDDTFARFGVSAPGRGDSIVLRDSDDPSRAPVTFTFERVADRLSLAGTLDGRRVAMRLRRLDIAQSTLLSRRFKWIEENSFHR